MEARLEDMTRDTAILKEGSARTATESAVRLHAIQKERERDRESITDFMASDARILFSVMNRPAVIVK